MPIIVPEEMENPFSNVRCLYGTDQILSVEEIKPDEVYLLMPRKVLIKVFSKPTINKDGYWQVHVLRIVSDDPSKNKPETLNLADYSITPYPSGMWSKQNWLSRS